MISIVIYELAVILLYLSIRALFPELFVTGVARVKAPVAARRHQAGRRSTARFLPYIPADSSRSAGMGMMIH